MSRHIIRIGALADFPISLRGCVVAIGNFDGVHRGHQAVLTKAIEEAAGEKPVIALTFEPHPRTLFAPDSPVERITPAPMKAEVLTAFGMDGVVELAFTRDFASLSADRFVRDVLLEGLGATHVVTGFDFHFGAKRQGGPAYLMDAGKQHGFAVTLVDAFRDEDLSVISSSRIRTLLNAGQVEEANTLLGYRFRVGATITKGKQLGRTLGYPTANMVLAPETPLAHGIYAVRFKRQNGEMHDGVASFGRRPTVDADGAPLLETFLFDFSGDLYGQEAEVILCAYLRGEEKFDGLDALVAQMKKDEAAARAYLAQMQPISALDATLSA